MSDIKSGFVYIYGHPAFPFLMKIGSSGKIDARVDAQIFATNLPAPGFRILQQKVRDYTAVENVIQETLKEYHCESNEHFNAAGDEWFFYCKDSIEKAKAVIKNFAIEETEEKIEKEIMDDDYVVLMKNGNPLYITAKEVPDGYIAQNDFKKDYYNFPNIRSEESGNAYGLFIYRVMVRSKARNINAYIVNDIKCFKKELLEFQRQIDSGNNKE